MKFTQSPSTVPVGGPGRLSHPEPTLLDLGWVPGWVLGLERDLYRPHHLPGLGCGVLDHEIPIDFFPPSK